jgi:hypothetical protein
MRIAALSLACMGCSLVAVRGPPDPMPAWPEPVHCTEKADAPGLDKAAAVAFGIPAVMGLAVGIIASTESCPTGDEVFLCGSALAAATGLLFGAASALLSGGYALSAWWGHSRTTQCRDEIETRTIANLLGHLSAPWDPGVSQGRLSFDEAQKFCADRKLRLPGRAELRQLSAELRSQGPVRLSLWTREFRLVNDDGSTREAPADKNLTVDAESLRALTVELGSGDPEARAPDDKFYALCIAR